VKNTLLADNLITLLYMNITPMYKPWAFKLFYQAQSTNVWRSPIPRPPTSLICVAIENALLYFMNLTQNEKEIFLKKKNKKRLEKKRCQNWLTSQKNTSLCFYLTSACHLVMKSQNNLKRNDFHWINPVGYREYAYQIKFSFLNRL
jgi:hypothetical protein